ncbi:AbrB/MazE/SpoVT family DNA-binding domain-containing protein [Schleiferilactobacillus shenzhenensis]|uniref:SpoVT-AbrB domain-containing protein n=1 Tax=Schleiferilactobacillus shenzhenensis LY-73 TaxID=1231336 RepID=U4TM30_9LACO|nr:AbrB/MazE/SpoVT family DNA-binding domain-containing protein [Schleiferilactobacillus shenzhenensis]ERL65264.1 hypothetical protein L248_2939 [Schleiferilactobacillus shenzhenensis LY-73]
MDSTIKRKILASAKITTKNQITVPKSVRTELHLGEHDELQFILQSDGSITITPKKKPSFWAVVHEQEKQYGNLSTPEVDWGADVGGEVID